MGQTIDLTALLIMFAAIVLFFAFLIFGGWMVRRAEERDIRTYREWKREKAARPENKHIYRGPGAWRP